MGYRNATIRELSVPDLTTTVLTLTLTGLEADSRVAGGDSPNWPRRLGAVMAIFAGAALGAGARHPHGAGDPAGPQQRHGAGRHARLRGAPGRGGPGLRALDVTEARFLGVVRARLNERAYAARAMPAGRNSSTRFVT